jgi:ice-binding like protein
MIACTARSPLLACLALSLSLGCGSSMDKTAADLAAATSLGSAAGFAVLSAAPGGTGAVTCTGATVTGDVGSSGQPVSVVQTGCVVAGAVVAPVSAQVLTDFGAAYDALAATACAQTLTGTLAGVTLAPGVYCFPAAATLTGTLTLDGPSTATWIFKVGTGGTGALTGTNFSVVMAGGGNPCNVTWWVAEAATLTTSQFIGNVFAGAAITATAGTTGSFNGRALAKAAVTLTGGTLNGCTAGAIGGGNDAGDDDHDGDDHDRDHHKGKCNQGRGNGSEDCDPGDSNHHNGSNDEDGGSRGHSGRGHR